MTPGACVNESGLLSSVAVVQSKSTKLCSSAAIVPQSKSTEMCSLVAVVPQSKSTELCSSAAVQGHPTTIFGRISVRKTILDLEFSKHLF